MICTEDTVYILFFFSSRRRHTRLQGDWSSDVCSSDLAQPLGGQQLHPGSCQLECERESIEAGADLGDGRFVLGRQPKVGGSGERRGGEEGRSRGGAVH